MNTRETLLLKTLQFKALHTGADNARFIDPLLEQNPAQADAITRNVCARIPLALAHEMESIGNMLDLNKREMITLAVIDFIRQAKETIDEFDAIPKEDEAS